MTRLRAAVPESPVVHTDDTSWRVGGRPAYLMAFDTDEATVYQIRSQHRHEEVQEVIPPDYAGVMATDRGGVMTPGVRGGQQQKCLAHILRSVRDVLRTKKGRARDFGERLKTLLQDAKSCGGWPQGGEGPDYEAQGRRTPSPIICARGLTDPDNQRLLNGIGAQHDRGNLLRFLEDPRIEPTNNRAERALRPAVIARTVSQCSKNDAGAHAFAAFTSVVRTLAKQGVASMVEGLYQIFRSAQIHTAPP